MGTPGDKLPISKVVYSARETKKETSESSSSSSAAVSSSSSMTVLQNVPDLGIFIEEDPTLQLLLDPTTASESDASSSSVPLLLDPFFEPTPVFTLPPDLNLPGPSGLQATKAQKRNKKLPQSSSSATTSSQTSKKSHNCNVCNKSFSTASKLATHQQQMHIGGTPFKCEHCKKSFSSKFKLMRHILIHSDRKPFSCTVCERTFHRKDHLKNHIKVHSPSKKVFVCERANCKKEYTSTMSYRKHLALHAAEEGCLECKICSKVFESKPEILYHLKIHAGSRTVKNPNEKKFTCDYCDRKFFTRKDVRRHLVVHTGSRNFLCQFCPQRFGRKDHLVRHIKKSHSKKYTEYEIASTEVAKVQKESASNLSETSLKLKPNLEIPISDTLVEFDEASVDETKCDIKLEELFPPTFSELSPMLCSQTPLPTDTEFLTELNAMKEELEDPGQQVLPSEIMDSDLLRLISEDEQNLPLPGFSQVFKQQEPPPPPPS